MPFFSNDYVEATMMQYPPVRGNAFAGPYEHMKLEQPSMMQPQCHANHRPQPSKRTLSERHDSGHNAFDMSSMQAFFAEQPQTRSFNAASQRATYSAHQAILPTTRPQISRRAVTSPNTFGSIMREPLQNFSPSVSANGSYQGAGPIKRHMVYSNGDTYAEAPRASKRRAASHTHAHTINISPQDQPLQPPSTPFSRLPAHHRKANSLPNQPSRGDLRELQASRKQKSRSLILPSLADTPPRSSSLANRPGFMTFVPTAEDDVPDGMVGKPAVPPKDDINGNKRPSLAIIPPRYGAASAPVSASHSARDSLHNTTRQSRSPSAPTPTTLRLFPPPSPQFSFTSASSPTKSPLSSTASDGYTIHFGSMPPTPVDSAFRPSESGTTRQEVMSCFEDYNDEGEGRGLLGFVKGGFGRRRGGSLSGKGKGRRSVSGGGSGNGRKRAGSLFGCFSRSGGIVE